MDYLANNRLPLAHGENPDLPGYSAEGAHVGGYAELSSAITDVDRAWSDAVYHRDALLDPRAQLIGYGENPGSGMCLLSRQYGRAPEMAVAEPTVYPWPAENATDVPLVFSANERPDPLQEARLTDPSVRTLGYLISATLNGPWADDRPRVYVQSASLVPDGGAAVRVHVSDSATPGLVNLAVLQPGFGLFPLEALSEATWYTASASGVVRDSGGREFLFARAWRFRTVGGVAEDQGAARGRGRFLRPPRGRLNMDRSGRILLAFRCTGAPGCAPQNRTLTLRRVRIPVAVRELDRGERASLRVTLPRAVRAAVRAADEAGVRATLRGRWGAPTKLRLVARR